MMIEFGPDLSHWDSNVSMATLKAAGAQGVILKATQGSSWVDPEFVMRVHQALQVGLLLGAYHFCDGSDPTMQAAHFLRVAGGIPGRLALDVEKNSSTGGTISVAGAAKMVSLIASAKNTPPIAYMPINGPDGHGTGLPNSILSRCPLWVPHYTTLPQPRLPSGWNTWMLWQYTSTGGDKNRFNGTSDDLAAWW